MMVKLLLETDFLNAERHAAIVPRVDRTMGHDFVMLVPVGLVGPDAWELRRGTSANGRSGQALRGRS